METIALDFDGVIHRYRNGYTGIRPDDEPVGGALEFVEDVMRRGYRVVIFTTRAMHPEGHDAIKEWLAKYGFPSNIQVTHEKIAASLYVDDRGIRFTGPQTFRHILHWLADGGHCPIPWTGEKWREIEDFS